MGSRRWTSRAALAFGLLAYHLSLFGYVVGTYTSSLEHLRDGLTRADFAVFSLREGALYVGSATLATALVGAALWYLLGERVERWTLRRRGALAGALTGLISIPATLAPAFASTTDLGPASALAVAVLLGLTAGLLFAGWLTVPAGALVGYALARRRSEATDTLAALVRRRF